MNGECWTIKIDDYRIAIITNTVTRMKTKMKRYDNNLEKASALTNVITIININKAGDPVCLFLFKFESSMLASWRSLPSYSNPDYVVNNDIRHWWNHWLLVSDNQRHWLQHFTLLMMMATMMMATMMMATMPRPKLEVYRHFLDWKTNTVSSPADVTAWWWWWWFFMFLCVNPNGTKRN